MFNAFRWIPTMLRRRNQVRKTRAVRPVLEVLEDRLVPAVLTVNSLEDSNALDAVLTLREAIAAIHAGSTLAFTPGEQAQISGPLGDNDRIVFASTLPSGTLRLTMEQFVLNRNVTIEGGGRTIVRSPATAGRLFAVNPNVVVRLSDLHLTGGMLNDDMGGAVFNLGTLTLDRVTISSSVAITGGAIANRPGGTLTVINSTLRDNRAFATLAGIGGAIDNFGTATIINSTLIGNLGQALGSLGGVNTVGAIRNANQLTIINSTIANNSAGGSGVGGIFTADGHTTSLFNTLLVGNTAGNVISDISGLVTAGASNNLVSQPAPHPGGFFQAFNILQGFTNFDPNSVLETIPAGASVALLKAGSPAINAGSDAFAKTPGPDGIFGNSDDVPLVFDQRGGVIRRVGASVDIGAVEFIPTEIVVDSLSDAVDGNGTPGNLALREAVQLANVAGGDRTITITAQGTINLTSELAILKTGTTTVRGPGANNLTIDAGGTSRIFNIFSPAGVVTRISGLTMQNGRALRGGGILSFETLILTNCTIRNCAATATFGGGIFSEGDLILNTVTIQNCQSEELGGGVFSRSTIIVNNSTFNDNRATKQGGGISAESEGVKITNSTFFGNTAGDAGGGLSVTSGEVTSSTFVNNTAENGGGGILSLGNTGSLSISNTIVVSNILNNVSGTFTNTNNVLAGIPSRIFVTDGNGNPLLADNGGPTKTVALLPNTSNPAFQASMATGTDQRGFVRKGLLGGVSDIGAYETNGSTIRVTTLADEDDGSAVREQGAGTSLREALALANSVAFATTIDFDSSLAGPLNLTRGELRLTNPQRVTVQGPGFGNIVITGSGQGRLFHATGTAVATISGLTLTNGRLRGFDGGAAIRATEFTTVSLFDLDIHGNTAEDAAAGIANLGIMLLDRVTIRNNTSSGIDLGSGGGIGNAGILAVLNSTVANNEARRFGGGIDNVGRLTVVNSTIAGNRSVLGGGILTDEFLPNVSTTLFNTLIIGNTTFGTMHSDLVGKAVEAASAKKLIGDANVNDNCQVISTTGNIIGATLADVLQTNAGALVVTLANGGKTPTIALVAGSAAINAGSNARAVDANNVALTTDQRGRSRIQGGIVDIGAIEFEVPSLPIAHAGGPYAIGEGQDLVLNASASTSPSMAELRAFSWDINGDGVYGDATGSNPTVSWDLLNELGITDGTLAIENVTVKVIDAVGGMDISDPVTLLVQNVAPTANLTNSGPVTAGNTATVTFVDQSDPSDPDTTAGFHYAYDFDNDGHFDVGDGTYAGSVTGASADVPAEFLANRGTTVRARIIDKDNAFTELTTDIEVGAESHFGSPIGIDVGGVRGQSLAGVIAAFIPAVGDVPEDFTALIFWDNGPPSEASVRSLGGGSFGVFGQHVYDAAGEFEITVLIVYRDVFIDLSSKAVVTVTSLDGPNGRLLIGGTPNRDTIVITPTATTGQVQVSINGVVHGPFRAGSIAAYGYDGNDTLTVGTLKVAQKVFKVKVPTLLLGGAGNDSLDAKLNKGSTMLVGGAGNDELIGSNVRDILIGGLGSDFLLGGGGDNILVGDPFVFEDQLDFSFQLLGQWARTDLKFKVRKASLEQIYNEQTLVSDAAVDQLFGGAAKDWFLGRSGEDAVRTGPGDIVTDLF